MAHRRVKDISYDDEDAGDYEEDYDKEPQGNSAEDQEQLRQGTAEVRKELGDEGDFTTDDEIRESLWYYYYDVEKTVAYLRKKRKPEELQQSAKKQKQLSKFDLAVQSTQALPADFECSQAPLWDFAKDLRSNAFFADVPFLAVPEHRQGIIHALPRFPRLRGRLLGGSASGASSSGKPSKLAALAASRKKAAEDKRKADASAVRHDQSSSSLIVLDRLGKRQKTNADGTEEVRQGVKDMEIAENPTPDDAIKSQTQPPEIGSRYSSKSYPKLEPKLEVPDLDHPPDRMELDKDDSGMLESIEAACLDELRAQPSNFANSIFSGSGVISQKLDPKHITRPLTLPYSALDINHSTGDPFAGPSPDDIVHIAQKGKGSKTQTPRSNDNKAAEKHATDGIASIKLNDGKASGTSTPQRIKYKNIDVVAEYAKTCHKRSANFVVIGHVDHGKSTLMGRLLYDTGNHISQRAFAKLASSASDAGKSSFSYAWLMDSTSEERARGITVDIAQTAFSTPECDFTILDAPGHKDFVPNMIAGAAQADFAVLVVDASRGQFEKGLEGGGQTKEHALLIRGLGVGRVIVAVNKMDMAMWDVNRFRDVEGQMSAFLSKVGYKKEDIRCIPCAGLTGVNVVYRTPPVAEESTAKSKAEKSNEKAEPKKSLTSNASGGGPDQLSWYTGATLLATLEEFAPSTDRHAALISKPMRLTISDIFRGGIANPLSVSGRLDAGSVQLGEILVVMPAAEACNVRGVQVEVSSDISPTSASTGNDHDSKQADYVTAGQIATLHLADIDPIHLRLGDVLCSASDPVRNIDSFTAKVLAFEHLVPGAVDCHRGRMHCAANVTKLLELVGGKMVEGAKAKKPRIVKPGQISRVVVELERPLPMEVGTRIVLRSDGTTVAAGLVESVSKQT